MSVYLTGTVQETFTDWPDNLSSAVIFFIAGCDHNCPDCQNQQLQKITNNENLLEFKDDHELANYIRLKALDYDTDKVILQGGDPLAECNRGMIEYMLRHRYPFEVCLYTGYTMEEIKEEKIFDFDNWVYNITFLKTGRYDKTQKQESMKTNDYLSFASKNQELYFLDKRTRRPHLVSENGIVHFSKIKEIETISKLSLGD